jgi:hypothetical protein
MPGNHMPGHRQRRLRFEGQATVDKAGSILFAGHYDDDDGKHRTVLCRLERQALMRCCGLSDPTEAALLDAYRGISDEVHQLASVQFYGGILRPVIRISDLNAAVSNGT